MSFMIDDMPIHLLRNRVNRDFHLHNIRHSFFLSTWSWPEIKSLHFHYFENKVDQVKTEKITEGYMVGEELACRVPPFLLLPTNIFLSLTTSDTRNVQNNVGNMKRLKSQGHKIRPFKLQKNTWKEKS